MRWLYISIFPNATIQTIVGDTAILYGSSHCQGNTVTDCLEVKSVCTHTFRHVTHTHTHNDITHLKHSTLLLNTSSIDLKSIFFFLQTEKYAYSFSNKQYNRTKKREKCPFFVAFCMELVCTSLVSGRICQKTPRRSSKISEISAHPSLLHSVMAMELWINSE